MPAASRREKHRALVIEDEADVRTLLAYNLEAAGYEVKAVGNSTEGLRDLAEWAPDVVVLDLMLPDISGIEVCRRIRWSGNRKQPVIVFVTARADEIDRVVSFEVGADDYVVKPFSVRELLLRIDVRLKARAAAAVAAEGQPERTTGGAPAAEGPAVQRLGPLEINTASHRVYVNTQEVHLSALEMRLLAYFFQWRGQVRSRRQLLTEVWGYQADVNSRTVDAHVKRLRDKLNTAGALIQTVRGTGYRLTDGAVGPSER